MSVTLKPEGVNYFLFKIVKTFYEMYKVKICITICMNFVI